MGDRAITDTRRRGECNNKVFANNADIIPPVHPVGTLLGKGIRVPCVASSIRAEHGRQTIV